jgi:hypothetical protein
MGKLVIVICAAAGAVIAVAAPAWAVGFDTLLQPGAPQQVYLRETQQVTARAQLIYKLADNDPAATAGAVEGRAELVEHSQGLVVYEPASASIAGKPALHDLQARPASPVHTTTTATVSWIPAAVLPTPRSF